MLILNSSKDFTKKGNYRSIFLMNIGANISNIIFIIKSRNIYI